MSRRSFARAPHGALRPPSRTSGASHVSTALARFGRLFACAGSVVLLGACLFLSFSGRARADGAPDVPGYREAIEEAVTEFDAHNYIEARALFARAHKLYPNARTLRGLGAVCFEQQHYGESVSYLERSLASHVRPLQGALREETERLLARAHGFVAEIELTLDPSDAHVIVDGTDEPPTATQPLRLEVGQHELEFRAPGYTPERRAFKVEGGESKTWSITLQRQRATEAGAPPAAPAAPAAPLVVSARPPRGSRRWQRALGGSALGLGLGAFTAAALSSVKRHNRASTFQANIPAAGTPDAPSAYVVAYGRWSSARTAPYAFEAVATSLITAGALTLLLSADRRAFPWWASALSGIAGVSLASWGLHDVVTGTTCGDGLDLRLCSKGQERRDRGALVALSALPFLAVPITQLMRAWLAPAEQSDTSFMLYPEASPAQRSMSLEARLQWL
ncbi:MAG: hypothetical protein JWN04_4921 [Myxococcaceae bacterium]|nr:hypothetical protein [Myxococcaceae bacterium]